MTTSDSLIFSLIVFFVTFLIVIGITAICTAIASVQMHNLWKDDEVQMKINKEQRSINKEESS